MVGVGEELGGERGVVEEDEEDGWVDGPLDSQDLNGEQGSTLPQLDPHEPARARRKRTRGPNMMAYIGRRRRENQRLMRQDSELLDQEKLDL